ncbi:MAG TPA: hypothetical protein VNZ58_13765 [Thermomicrobiales bacterium]|nr:hypothetical protein [Thermomicrobiales bacterium]
MPATTDPSDNSGERHQKTRLEVEIEEILERAEREHPLPPPTPIRTKPIRPSIAPPSRDRLGASASAIRRWLVAVPFAVAFMLAIVANMVSGFSPFLARIAVDLAIVAVFWPIFESIREKQSAPATTMWRGREMEIPVRHGPSPWAQFRQWLRDRRILP